MDKSTTSQFRISFARIGVEIKAEVEAPKSIFSLMSIVKSACRKSSMNGCLLKCLKCKIFGTLVTRNLSKPKVLTKLGPNMPEKTYISGQDNIRRNQVSESETIPSKETKHR